jgi:hypothetical protein
MADFLTEAYYRYDFALFMAKVGVAMTLGHPSQVAAVADAEAALAMLRDSDAPEPDDLAEHTAAEVAALEARYSAQFDAAQQQMALTPEQQQVFGVDVQRAQTAATTAASWLSAINAARIQETP